MSSKLELVAKALAEGKTHALAVYPGCSDIYGNTLRQINKNGYDIYELQGSLVMSLPNEKDPVSGANIVWPVYGFYTKTEGEIVKKALREHKEIFEGKKILINTDVSELNTFGE